MCGIAGFVGKGSREALERMTHAVVHRGPDDQGIICKEDVGLAHTRLSIIDLSSAGHQPMWNEDKSTALIFNGEIYNFKNLRTELQKNGSVFKTGTDTEVIIRLYEREGERCFEKLTGMFALALYDFKKKCLLLARDRMGEKPLYWSRQNETFIFASELGALMESGLVAKEVDPASLNAYLLFDYVPTPSTILRGVNKLEPGTYLKYEKGGITKHTFWHPPHDLLSLSESEALARLDVLMRESVTEQLISDAPLGVYLSGGIDSSTIAWYAAQHSSSRVDTFSIGFDDPNFDESSYARQVAAHLGVTHHEQVVTAREALEIIPHIPDIFSEPVADASVIPTALLSQFTRQHVTVAVGGDGGDELFAGYPTFDAERYFAVYRRLPHALKTLGTRVIEALPADDRNFSLSFNLKKFISSENEKREYRHQEWLGSFTKENRELLASGALRHTLNTSVFQRIDQYCSEFTQLDDMNRLLYTYLRTYLMDEVLVKVDRASMHYGLEVRAPFLDHRVVDFLFSLPYSFKYKNGQTKYLLKKLMRGRLPENIISRKKKGFGVPMATWLKGELKELCAELLSPSELGQHGYFNPAYVARLQREHLDGRRDNRKQLWNLMTFQMWYNRWIT